MLSDDDLVEAGRLRRRRLFGALHAGSQETPGGTAPPALSRLAAGLGVAAMLAVGTGVGGVVQTALSHGH